MDEKWLVNALRDRKMTVTTAESCTGGMVAAAITSVPGSSEVFRQGFVTYCDEAKHRLLGVRKKTLRTYTAVSGQTAAQMASGGRKRAKADGCIAVTGYAGPAFGEEPVGLVYIGCCIRGRGRVLKCHFTGSRQGIRTAAKEQAIALFCSMLAEEPLTPPGKLLHKRPHAVDFFRFLR